MVAAVVLLSLVTSMLASSVAASAPAKPVTNPIRAENAKAGTPGWLAPAATGRAIEGYASEVSVRPGETMHFHVSTMPAARYRVVVYRLGWYRGVGARRIACLPGCTADEAGVAQPQPTPETGTGRVEAGWPVTDQLTVPSTGTSGYYLAEFVLTNGAQAGRAALTYVIVREPPGRRSAILVQVPVNTWQAYNDWGGKSLYDNLSTDGRRANRVSFDRPYDWSPRPGGQPLEWEYPLVRWLERTGYDVSYQTDVDADADPASLVRHRLVMTAGHGEYWTKTIRDAFESSRDLGTNLAFMGANTGYWQVRYEDGGRTIVGYKSRYDPEPDPALKTTMFRDLVPPRYECELIGIQSQGVGLTWQPSDYVVTPSAIGDPWLNGTGLTAGATLKGIVSVESDTIPGNQTAGDSCGHALTVFLHHETGSDKSGNADAVRYTAASGARVFASGSHTFAWALDDDPADPDQTHGLADPRLQRFMRNALADLTSPAPPSSIDARPFRQGVRVRFVRAIDPRVRRVLVFRHGGVAPFGPSSRGARLVCSSRGSVCRDAPPQGIYRYAAVAVDRWGRSAPMLSSPVRAA
jgi:hypothetical protein